MPKKQARAQGPSRLTGVLANVVLHPWSLKALVALLLLSAVGLVWRTYQKAERVVEAYVTEMAQEHAASATHFRNFYTDEIVPRARAAGMDITHNYRNQKNALPLPATLALDLGHYLSANDNGTQIRLYSDYPFEGRQSGRELDPFQREALIHLRQYPSIPFVRHEVIDGQSVVRYAQADRMLPSCVACHNSHAGSPKTDWVVGDVRGALEVTLPAGAWKTAAADVLTESFTAAMVVLLFGLALTAMVFYRLQTALSQTRQMSIEREITNRRLRQEIQERQLVEQDLKARENQLNSIFESVPEGIVVIDTQGTIVQANQATSHMFGHPLGALLGQSVACLMAPDERLLHGQDLETYLRSGVQKMLNRPRVLQGHRQDGTRFPLQLTVIETRIGEGRFFMGVMQDFSAIQAAQDALLQAKTRAEVANRLKGEFLANMSHEIRTPMNGVLGLTELVLDTELQTQQREYLSLVRDSAQDLLRIINDILDFSKIESGALDLQPVRVDIEQMLRHLVRGLQPSAHAKGLRLSWSRDAALPQALVLDPVRLRQVLTNLVGNAIKFTASGGVHISVSADAPPPGGGQMPDGAGPLGAAAATIPAEGSALSLRFEVRDTGMGFDQNKVEVLFQPFVQADGSITRNFGGTGLGLAISRRLVQLMGGEIAASGQPNQGATFAFSVLGAWPQTQVLPEAQGEPDALTELGRLKVLLAEDHPVNQMLARFLLEKMGHQCVLAQNGEEALASLAQERFDLVLMDVMMPGVDGLSALAQLRAREATGEAHTPVLMVTAHAMDGDKERFLAAGADGYVSKPISAATLEAEMRRVLRARSALAPQA